MARAILLAGGGTAGHVNPLLATAHELRERGFRVMALGTAEGLESDLVPRDGLDLRIVPRTPLPRRPGMELLRLPGKLRAAVRAAGAAIDECGADAVVGFGGYVSVPAYVAARRRKIPIVVHEGNARPGLANRLGARLSRHVAVTVAGTRLRHAHVTGMPLRAEVVELAASLRDEGTRAAIQRDAREALGWPADAPVLLATGGSSGAQSLNAAMVEAAPRLVGHGIYIIHLTGRGKGERALRKRQQRRSMG